MKTFLLAFLMGASILVAQEPPMSVPTPTRSEPVSSLDLKIQEEVAKAIKASAVSPASQSQPSAYDAFTSALSRFLSQERVQSVLIWLGIMQALGVWLRDRSRRFFSDMLMRIAKTEDEDDDEALRKWLSKPFYRFVIVPVTVALLPLGLPTLAEFERVVRLEKEAVASAMAAANAVAPTV
jgi:hypothetical protein